MTDRNDNVLLRLHEIVQAEPDLQSRLFNLKDVGDFMTEVQRLAAAHEVELDEDSIRQAMRAAQMGWIERRLP